MPSMAGKTVLITGGIGKANALGLGARRGFIADLSSQQEVRSLADDVLHGLDRLDVLVNNVGGFWNTRRVTVDGLE